MLRNWADMKLADFANLDPESTVIVQPIAAIEQHGPHLPTGTDLMIGDGLMRATSQGWQPDFDVIVLPSLPYGKSDEHMSFPGTITLTTAAYIKILRNIGQSVVDTGLPKLLIMSSHGGNSAAMEMAAQELRRDHGMFVVAANWMRLNFAKGHVSDHEIAYGIHGGLIETALMLHLNPELVDMDKAQDFKGKAEDMADEFSHLRGHGKLSFSWMTEDLSEDGVIGDAASATAELGAALAASAVDEMRKLLSDMAKFELRRLL